MAIVPPKLSFGYATASSDFYCNLSNSSYSKARKFGINPPILKASASRPLFLSSAVPTTVGGLDQGGASAIALDGDIGQGIDCLETFRDIDVSELGALAPLDGRYSSKVKGLRSIFSEFGLIWRRVAVEIYWLLKLSKIPEISEVPKFSKEAELFLLSIISNFNLADASAIKDFERVTNHDVKAVEYFLKEKIKSNSEVSKVLEFVHFACTSEDINNLAHGLMLKNGLNVLLPAMDRVIADIRGMAHRYASLAMLSRTHGQPASPTTLGKEMAIFCQRLKMERQVIANVEILGKMAGAVGNYNAHHAAYPNINWESVAEQFVSSFGIAFNPYVTQVEPHDYIARLFDAISRFNNILTDFDQDIWLYISLGYFKQRPVAGEVGSSTMPHKVNPIDFENSEGNLGLANASLSHLSAKLSKSRWQRDLTDSTVLRNLGVGLGYSLVAYGSTLKGISKLEVNENAIREDLNQHWEVLAEPIQTIMRRHGIQEPYEKLKKFTRGREITRECMLEFVEKLELPENVKESLRNLTPESYIGYAISLAKRV